jgi:hypothetical protein
MFEFLVAVIIAGSIWYRFTSWTRSQDSAPPKRRSIPQNVYEWPDTGKFDCDIVGESFYQSAIKQLAGTNNEHVEEREYTAFLIPEDDNPHDDKAIRVDIWLDSRASQQRKR